MIGTLILLVAYVLATIGAMQLLCSPAPARRCRRGRSSIPIGALLVLGYTIYRNVCALPGDARRRRLDQRVLLPADRLRDLDRAVGAVGAGAARRGAARRREAHGRGGPLASTRSPRGESGGPGRARVRGGGRASCRSSTTTCTARSGSRWTAQGFERGDHRVRSRAGRRGRRRSTRRSGSRSGDGARRCSAWSRTPTPDDVPRTPAAAGPRGDEPAAPRAPRASRGTWSTRASRPATCWTSAGMAAASGACGPRDRPAGGGSPRRSRATGSTPAGSRPRSSERLARAARRRRRGDEEHRRVPARVRRRPGAGRRPTRCARRRRHWFARIEARGRSALDRPDAAAPSCSGSGIDAGAAAADPRRVRRLRTWISRGRTRCCSRTSSGDRAVGHADHAAALLPVPPRGRVPRAHLPERVLRRRRSP